MGDGRNGDEGRRTGEERPAVAKEPGDGEARRLREAMRLLARASGALERDRGCCVDLTFGECWALVEIHRLGEPGKAPQDAAGLSVQELADRLFLDKSAASRLADRLVRSGRAERNPDPTDRRILRLAATPEGHRTAEVIERDQDAFWREILRDVPEEGRPGAVEGVEALARSAIRRFSDRDGTRRGSSEQGCR
jgi:DNA-binding MarR family transcriptional regulator